ncbi:MAG TPA: TrkA C-terminal domain-containing protein [Acidimicrobiales bacterium]|nr:TrkA C-terminal domain-containing protein [Acidimicrobiales bacterium]
MDVRVREQRLPGIGHRYDIELDDGRRLFVVVQGDGRRAVGIAEPGSDRPEVTVSLSQDQAVAAAAILTGARFSIDTSEDDRIPGDEVAVETIILGEASPAVGRVAREVADSAGPDVAILAVIRDETPDVIEDALTEPIRPGDRIVVAARREQVDTLVRRLTADR